MPIALYLCLSVPSSPHLARICTVHVRDSSSRLRAVYFYDHGSILHCARPLLISASPVHSASLPVCSSLHPPLHLGRCLHSPSSRDRASPPQQPRTLCFLASFVLPFRFRHAVLRSRAAIDLSADGLFHLPNHDITRLQTRPRAPCSISWCILAKRVSKIHNLD